MDIIGPVVDSAIPGAPNPELDCGEGDEGVLSRELGFGRTKVRRARVEFRPPLLPANSGTLRL